MNNLEAEGSRVAEIAEFGVKLRGLVAICNKPAPTPEELEERDALVKFLAEEGFDKEEIFALIGGKLAVDTIRKKIAGVVKSDSPIKARITSIVAEMVLHQIPFTDIPKATGIMKVLGSRNVGLGDVASLIEECKQGNQDLKSVIDSFADLKQSGISIQQLAEGLANKKDLVEMGLQVSDLQKIAEIARKNGREPGKVFDSICASDNLKATQLELDQARKDLDNTKLQIDKSKTELMKTEAEIIHLQPAIAMCEDLLYTYKFTTHAIRSVIAIAKKYGKPYEVIKAVEAFGDIKALEDTAHELQKQNIRWYANLREKEKAVAALDGQLEALKSSISVLLKSVTEQIGRAWTAFLREGRGG